MDEESKILKILSPDKKISRKVNEILGRQMHSITGRGSTRKMTGGGGGNISVPYTKKLKPIKSKCDGWKNT